MQYNLISKLTINNDSVTENHPHLITTCCRVETEKYNNWIENISENVQAVLNC